MNNSSILRVVCYSGGHSSAIAAIEVVRKFGKNNVVLLNHDINGSYEHQDIKRFKKEVAQYLKVPVTYANHGNEETNCIPSQFEVCKTKKAFKVNNGQELCTYELKTKPFYNWLNLNTKPAETVVYYGFDKNEQHRVIRRRKHLEILGYTSDYPLAEWNKSDRTIKSTTEIGIHPPLTYSVFNHGNCLGCLKAGKQHWYVIYCLYPEIYQEGVEAENCIGYTIHPDASLLELSTQFEKMRLSGITATEKISSQKFWSQVNKAVPSVGIQRSLFELPCDCAF